MTTHKYNENGTIDTTINHPEFGLIPCTVAKDDPETAELFAQLKDLAEPYIAPIPTQAELDAIALAQAAQARTQAMQTGFTYNGHQISVTSEDGAGLLQVKGAFELGVTETTIHFTNGTKLPMTASEFPAFALLFVTERNKYFTEV